MKISIFYHRLFFHCSLVMTGLLAFLRYQELLIPSEHACGTHDAPIIPDKEYFKNGCSISTPTHPPARNSGNLLVKSPRDLLHKLAEFSFDMGETYMIDVTENPNVPKDMFVVSGKEYPIGDYNF